MNFVTLGKGLVVFVILGLAGGLVYYQWDQLRPCVHPIVYSIGYFDDRFNVSREAFEENLKRAAKVWNDALKKDFFVYAEEGGMPVHLRYDYRQETVDLGSSIDSAQSRYDAERLKVEAAQRAYERNKRDYNQDVQYWNARGGAPPNAFKELEETRKTLQAELADLQQDIAHLNAMARDINAEVRTYNSSIDEPFEAGKYVRDRTGEYVELYEFENTSELVRIAAHEFGHALGLGHVSEPTAIMYPENKVDTVVLTAADRAALRVLCGT